MEVYFVTGNKNKLQEAEKILGTKLNHIDLDLDELQGLDTKKIAEHKVKQAWDSIKKPLFLWDQSMNISCLNGFPGPLIKWFWTSVGLEKICTIANHFKDHNITTTTTLVYYDGKNIHYFVGEIEGTIAEKPRGDKGWAWDPIFIPKGHVKTYAEMDSTDLFTLRSHGLALEKFRDFVQTHLN